MGLSESGFAERIGEVQASPTANTVLDRLKQLLTGIVLATGTNNIGDVDVLTLPALPAGSNQIGTAVRDRDALAAVTLQASGAQAASGSGSDVTDANLEKAEALLLVLDVTAQSGTTPTLDVVVQVKVGSLYYNLARFAQRGATTKTALVVKRLPTLTSELTLEADPAVGTGVLNNDGAPWLDTLRVKWTIGGGTPSYTFSVVAYPVK